MIDILPLPATAVCDFCLLVKPLVEIYYPRPGPRKFMKLVEDKPGWAACASCKQLLDKREFKELAIRAIDTDMAKTGIILSMQEIRDAADFLIRVYEDNF